MIARDESSLIRFGSHLTYGESVETTFLVSNESEVLLTGL